MGGVKDEGRTNLIFAIWAREARKTTQEETGGGLGVQRSRRPWEVNVLKRSRNTTQARKEVKAAGPPLLGISPRHLSSQREDNQRA